MYELYTLLDRTMEEGASDLHLTVGAVPIIRVNGELVRIGSEILLPVDTDKFAREILEDKYDEFIQIGEYDTSYSLKGVGRFRVNIFKQRNSVALALRTISLAIPTLKDLNMPSTIRNLTEKKRGLVLVTGPTGSGKSTTLAAMIDEINHSRGLHIVTLEDPIEFLHKHDKSIINQREIGKDSQSYENALRAVLREDPDVILVGEMRDLNTISVAITAAETGHLVFSTLHTIGAAKTIDRIVDVFPTNQQQQIKVQLAAVLQGIVSQQLVETTDNKRTAALEIMIATPAIQNLIREGKTHQIQTAMQTGARYGMVTMDASLKNLVENCIITPETALNYAIDKEMLSKMLLY